MSNKSGGQNLGSNSNSAEKQPQKMSSAERQRQTAINLARQKVLKAYEKQNAQFSSASNYVSGVGSSAENSNMNGARNTNARPQITESEWRKYHTAWQNYYQQYYGDYYNKAAMAYISKEKNRLEKEQCGLETVRQGLKTEQEGLKTQREGFNLERAEFEKKLLDFEQKRLEFEKEQEEWQKKRSKRLLKRGADKDADKNSTKEAKAEARELKKIEQEREKLEKERLQLTEMAKAANISPEELESKSALQKSLREKIRGKVNSRAKKMYKSRHFLPIVLGLIILILGLLFENNQVIFANIVAYMSPGSGDGSEIQTIDSVVSAAVHDEPTLMIPKLNVESPVAFGVANDVDSMQTAMYDGLANFSTSVSSAKPGQVGNFAVSGHSAGNIYDTRSRYKFIFSGLTRMNEGDMVYMDYEGKRYAYKITGAIEVDPSNVAALRKITTDNPGKPMITLITCTPLGTSKYRLLVYGEQVYPDYGNAIEASAENLAESDMNGLANSPSPMGSVWNWLTGQK